MHCLTLTYDRRYSFKGNDTKLQQLSQRSTQIFPTLVPSHNEPLQPLRPLPDLVKQTVPLFDYCTMPSVDTGEIFICELITRQVQADASAENKGSNIEEQLDKDDGDFSMQTGRDVDEMDIYELLKPRPSDAQPSNSIHQDAENTPQIPLPLPKIAAPPDVRENGDATHSDAKISPEPTPHPSRGQEN